MRLMSVILALHNLRRIFVGCPACCENTRLRTQGPISQNNQNHPAIMQRRIFTAQWVTPPKRLLIKKYIENQHN